MRRFSIRTLLFATLFAALSFASCVAVGVGDFFCLLAWALHFAALCILPVAAFEYQGHRKRFAIAALIFEIVFLVVARDTWTREIFAMLSVFALIGSYFAGILSAAAYRAIALPDEPRQSWRPLDLMTCLLSRILHPNADPKNNG